MSRILLDILRRTCTQAFSKVLRTSAMRQWSLLLGLVNHLPPFTFSRQPRRLALTSRCVMSGRSHTWLTNRYRRTYNHNAPTNRAQSKPKADSTSTLAVGRMLMMAGMTDRARARGLTLPGTTVALAKRRLHTKGKALRGAWGKPQERR